MQHTEQYNNPMARPLVTLQECSYSSSVQRTTDTNVPCAPTVPYTTRACVQSTEVSQHHREKFSTTTCNQRFCYSNHPMKCSTAVQLIHTGRYHEHTSTMENRQQGGADTEQRSGKRTTYWLRPGGVLSPHDLARSCILY